MTQKEKRGPKPHNRPKMYIYLRVFKDFQPEMQEITEEMKARSVNEAMAYVLHQYLASWRLKNELAVSKTED